MVREVCINMAIIEPGSCLHGGQRLFIDDNSGGAVGDGIKASRQICPRLLGLRVSGFGLGELTGRLLDEIAEGGAVVKLAEGLQIPRVEGFDEASCLVGEEIREVHGGGRGGEDVSEQRGRGCQRAVGAVCGAQGACRAGCPAENARGRWSRADSAVVWSSG